MKIQYLPFLLIPVFCLQLHTKAGDDDKAYYATATVYVKFLDTHAQRKLALALCLAHHNIPTHIDSILNDHLFERDLKTDERAYEAYSRVTMPPVISCFIPRNQNFYNDIANCIMDTDVEDERYLRYLFW